MAVRRNLVANLVGSAWTGIVALVFIPVYLRAIGAEGYGLVGFFVTLASLMTIFDGGFGAATARELARASEAADFEPVRDLVRTLELIFWAVAAVLGGITAIAAPLIANHWLNLGTVVHAEALRALRLMGLALALQWPIAYYTGCLVGLQRQVGLNLINIIALTLRFGGGAAVLTFLSATVPAFFLWQAFATFLHVVALRLYLWHSMPGSRAPAFSLGILRNVGRFAIGVACINVLGLILTQIDKVVLSKILPLEQFGYYTLAATLAAVVGRVVMPIFNATYPKLTFLASSNDTTRLTAFYRLACTLMAFAIVPLSGLLIVFGREILSLWTGDPELSRRLQWVVACLVAGTLFNGLMTVPYALQLAKGWTSLAIWQNVVAVVILVSAIGLLTTRFGLVGAAGGWLAINAGYILISAPIMYSKLLRGEKWNWYFRSVILPIVAALVVLLAVKLISSVLHTSGIGLFALLAGAGLLAQIAVGLTLKPGFTLAGFRDTSSP